MTEAKYRQDVSLIISGVFTGLSDAHDAVNSGLCNQGTTPTNYWTIDTNDATVSTLSRPHPTTGETCWCQVKAFSSGRASTQLLGNGTGGVLTSPRYQSTNNSDSYQGKLDFYNSVTYISVTDRLTALMPSVATHAGSILIHFSDVHSGPNYGEEPFSNPSIEFAGNYNRTYYTTTYTDSTLLGVRGEIEFRAAERPAYGPNGTANCMYVYPFKLYCIYARNKRAADFECPTVYLVKHASSETTPAYATINSKPCYVSNCSGFELAWEI